VTVMRGKLAVELEEEDERHGWKSGDASNMANGAVADGYLNRTTRRSKALKGTAQGVRQLAPSPLPQPSERGSVRPRLFSSGKKKGK
jgi:hypothetical protein